MTFDELKARCLIERHEDSVVDADFSAAIRRAR
jgi:hypothetical protein